MNPLEHQSLLMELPMAQELQAVKNLPRIKLVRLFTPSWVYLWLWIIWGHTLSCNFFIYISARATLEILIPDFVKQTAEEKPVEGDELEVHLLIGVMCSSSCFMSFCSDRQGRWLLLEINTFSQLISLATKTTSIYRIVTTTRLL